MSTQKNWKSGFQGRIAALEAQLAEIAISTGTIAADVQGDVTGNVLGHLTDVDIIPDIVDPVDARASLSYNNVTLPTAGKKVTVNGKAYTFRASVAVEGDVKIGASPDATLTNFVNAINKSGGTNAVGGDYLVALANPDASATVDTGTNVVTFVARISGAAGNALTLTTDEVTFSVTDFATTNTGMDGTPGLRGDLRFSEAAIYVCIADCTVSGPGGSWKKSALVGL